MMWDAPVRWSHGIRFTSFQYFFWRYWPRVSETIRLVLITCSDSVVSIVSDMTVMSLMARTGRLYENSQSSDYKIRKQYPAKRRADILAAFLLVMS